MVQQQLHVRNAASIACSTDWQSSTDFPSHGVSARFEQHPHHFRTDAKLSSTMNRGIMFILGVKSVLLDSGVYIGAHLEQLSGHIGRIGTGSEVQCTVTIP